MWTPIPEAERRIFTARRAEQGFRSQAHLDAFYAARDHEDSCTACQTPGPAMPLDDGQQPTMRRCAESLRLTTASWEV